MMSTIRKFHHTIFNNSKIVLTLMKLKVLPSIFKFTEFPTSLRRNLAVKGIIGKVRKVLVL